MRENLSGIMVIRAFNMQQHEEERFDRANQDLTGNILFINRVMASMFPFMMVIMNGISLLIYLGWIPPGGTIQHAGRGHDGFHAVRNADRHVIPHDVNHVY